MSKLPNLPYRDSITKTTQVQFGGLRHHDNCADGELFDMENLTCRKYPLLAVRERRKRRYAQSVETKQIYGDNGVLICVDDLGLLYNGYRLQSISLQDGEHTQFVRFGDRVLIMPDKLLLNLKYKILGFCSAVEELEQLSADANLYDAYAVGEGEYSVYVWDGKAWKENGLLAEPVETETLIDDAQFRDGTIYGDPAKANTIFLMGVSYEEFTKGLHFREGDAVEISGCAVVPYNNKTAILREIEAFSDEHGMVGVMLHFSDYCFKLEKDAQGEPKTFYMEPRILLRRTMPDMAVIFEHQNRLWGAKGKEIFASKMGDPFNWNCFDGLATDSFYLQTQDKGEITAGISYGYPRFFREDSMTTVYGTMPSAFQTQATPLAGVKAGEQKSLAGVNGLLLWLSREGMMIFDGSGVYLQDQVFGDWELQDVIAQTDAVRYYAKADLGAHPLADGERLRAVFCYDTNKGIWTKEEDFGFISMTYLDGEVLALEESGKIAVLNGGALDAEGYAEEPVYSFAEFGDFTLGSPNRKAVSVIQLRLTVEEGARLWVKIRYDSRGEWITVKQIAAGAKRSVYLPVIPHRCDHYRIRLEGVGEWTLYSMAKEFYVGSEKH